MNVVATEVVDCTWNASASLKSRMALETSQKGVYDKTFTPTQTDMAHTLHIYVDASIF